MYKLTIKQTKITEYKKDDGNVSYESEQEVSYKSKDLASLLTIVTHAEQLVSTDTTYTIEREDEVAEDESL